MSLAVMKTMAGGQNLADVLQRREPFFGPAAHCVSEHVKLQINLETLQRREQVRTESMAKVYIFGFYYCCY